MEAATHPDLTSGLRASEVDERRARGQVNDLPDSPTRTVREIIRANILTPFNFLLGGLLVVILVVGPLNDALFGGVIIANTLIGIFQEVRAKRTLDRLAVLSSPRATVRRDGQAQVVAINELVLDDIIELAPGDQVPVVGRVVSSRALEVDESLLTGESDAVVKEVDDQVLSGSFVAAGSGVFQATRVGAEAYASQIAADARRFTLARSELRSGIDLIIRIVGFLMIPTGTLLLVNQIRLHLGIADAIGGTVAGLVAMVPEGLILLTSVAFAASVVRLGRRHVLVQELPAVETLARIDVICLDKTGTLTEGTLRLSKVVPGPGVTEDAARAALAALVAVEPSPNATLRALAVGVLGDAADKGGTPLPDAPLVTAAQGRLQAQTPFSSARKWSSATFGDGTTWVLGAPDVVLRHIDDAAALEEAVATYAAQGRRVLLLATAQQQPGGDELPPKLRPHTIALLEDQVRAAAADTLAYFAAQDVTVKIISGDHPATVTAIARRAGLEVDHGVDAAVDLPDDPEALADAVEAGTVFGRVSPRQKRAMVKALQSRQHVVAMTGDGVNDVLALKDADIGVAMGSGAAATRAAAQLVLLDGDFSALPAVVAEGRQVIANIERVSNLFLTKTVYAMLLALAVGVAGLPFPFLPRHLTLVGTLTIGIPAFFLALAPNTRRAEPHFVARVLRFAVPAGLLCAAATFAGYYVARVDTSLSLDQQRTTATIVLVSLGLLILIHLATPMTKWRKVLVGSMVGAFVVSLVWPFARRFYALSLPGLPTFLAIVGIVALAWWVMELATKLTALYRRPYERLTAAQDRRSAKEAATRATRNEQGSRTIDFDAPVTRAYPPVAAQAPDPTVAQGAPDPTAAQGAPDPTAVQAPPTEVVPAPQEPTRSPPHTIADEPT
jgi:cation-transporting ATPase E